MRVPLSWLREWTDWTQDASRLAEALTARGVAVEAVERAAAPAGLVAARLLAVEPHPSAARLLLCTVRAGARRARVVCGAPDAAPGLLVPWALPGARLPDGREIGRREIAGVDSEGMLCAADELGLPGGHDGLLHLEGAVPAPGGPAAQEGDDVAAWLGLDDPVLVLELTPNYAVHCQSILGVAREVAALRGGALRWPPTAPPEDGADPAAARARVEVLAGELCPRYVARVLRGVPHSPTPLWMARRLVQCGMRPIGPVVDVTNYVLLELGQPLHAFDLDTLAGGGVQARRARPGEAVVTLDGRERLLVADDLVIADDAGPAALAGVMGAQRTEVTAATRGVLLESACFAPEAVARTARRLGLSSEASARFARGVDPALAAVAADRAALLLSAAGLAVCRGRIEAGPGLPATSVELRGRTVRAMLGVRLSTAAAGRHLERLGFTVRAAGADRLRVEVPSWRRDVALEADLIEEVARSYGYEHLPAALPPGDPGVALPDPGRAALSLAREVCLAAGCTEVQPYSFHGGEVWDRLRLPPDHPWRLATAVTNPMHADQAWLRTTLATGLLQTLERNARQRCADAVLFESGRVFRPQRPGAHPVEVRHLGLAGYGALRPAGWGHPAEPCDFFGLKGILEEFLRRMRGPAALWARAGEGYPLLHPGRAAHIWLPGADGAPAALLGWVGELHPAVGAAFGLPQPAAAAELDLDALTAALGEAPFALRPLPRHPAVRRDLAVVVPMDLPAADLEAEIARAGGDLLAEVRLFDVYAGEGLGAGRRSLAFTLTYQADRTLTDAEVEARQAAVRAALAALEGVQLRA